MDKDLLTQATNLIARFEAYRFHAYPDPTTGGAPWTVGYGATGPHVGPNTAWTKPIALADLQERIRALYASMTNMIVTPLSNNQWSAVLSFAYNCGLGAFQGSHLRESINSGKLDTITRNFESWDKAAGSVNQALLSRRRAEAKLFLS